MSDEYGSDYISISDEDGNEFELELLDAFEHKGTYYHAFIPAGGGSDEDDLEIIILKSVEENGEEVLSTVDTDEELEEVYAIFMERLYELEE